MDRSPRPDARELEYLVRRQGELIELMAEQIKENTVDNRKNADAILQFRTGVAIWSTVIATAVTLAMKMLLK